MTPTSDLMEGVSCIILKNTLCLLLLKKIINTISKLYKITNLRYTYTHIHIWSQDGTLVSHHSPADSRPKNNTSIAIIAITIRTINRSEFEQTKLHTRLTNSTKNMKCNKKIQGLRRRFRVFYFFVRE